MFLLFTYQGKLKHGYYADNFFELLKEIKTYLKYDRCKYS